MAQDPEDQQEPEAEDAVDISHDLDMVPLYDSLTVDAEIEAEVIQGILQVNGVPSIMVSAAVYPNLGFTVKVPRARLEEARRLVDEAQAAGPEAAAEAEAATEEDQ